MTRTCKTCGKTKSLAEFYRTRRDGAYFQRSCKKCVNARSNKRAKDNPKKHCERITRWRKMHSGLIAERDWKYALKAKFGITPEEYAHRLNEQAGCCVICGLPQTEFKKRFAVDHDHETGEVRGLLCSKCNTALGLMDENSARLRNAAAYLEYHK